MAFSFWKKMFAGSDAAREAVADDAPQSLVDDTALEETAENQTDLQDADNAEELDYAPEAADEREDRSPEAQAAGVRNLEDFVGYVTRKLVDNPEAVTLNTVEKERLTVIQIRCEKKDIGKLVGKNGKTIAAIRTLVSGAGGRLGLRITVDVLD